MDRGAGISRIGIAPAGRVCGLAQRLLLLSAAGQTLSDSPTPAHAEEEPAAGLIEHDHCEERVSGMGDAGIQHTPSLPARNCSAHQWR